MNNILEKCVICPHQCKVDRTCDKRGFCRANDKVKIALASIHHFEEPCISGENGSGTIFFSNCNMKCVYCQNHEISQEDFGKEISIEHLSNIFLNKQKEGVHNINLVTPTIYVLQIIEAIKLAKNNGLTIPIIYNSSGYESKDTLKLLEGYIDVYLPDFKYMDDEIAFKYSKIKNYSSIAKDAINEMYRQVGTPVLDDKGIIKKGLIIRHMILPSHIYNTKKVLEWINKKFGNKVYVSVMAQYFPAYKAKDDAKISRKITIEEYNEVEEYLYSLDLENGYIQELGEHEEEYVPKFDLSE